MLPQCFSIRRPPFYTTGIYHPGLWDWRMVQLASSLVWSLK
jgi:hypothetical protein